MKINSCKSEKITFIQKHFWPFGNRECKTYHMEQLHRVVSVHAIVYLFIIFLMRLVDVGLVDCLQVPQDF